jgi:hypothetical protein
VAGHGAPERSVAAALSANDEALLAIACGSIQPAVRAGRAPSVNLERPRGRENQPGADR